ncbi:MAG: PilZ domain-containing protein [Nitrospirae bacterium]|nr:PilZ domain-containing protein [Nitrospirota bacterium]MDA1303934.1 PilZ domain-containing protein [Nitrospirota bacterium]
MVKTERRKIPRVAPVLGAPLSVEIRASQNKSLSAKLLNLSRHGALLEIDRPQSSPIRVDERVSVKLRLPHDVIWVAGIVRHCYASRLGVFFPAGVRAALPKSNRVFPKTIKPVERRRAPQEVVLSL